MGETNLHATVVGAGLAGSEAAWQLACRGIQVTLVEGKPQVHSRYITLRTLPSWCAAIPCAPTSWRTP